MSAGGITGAGTRPAGVATPGGPDAGQGHFDARAAESGEGVASGRPDLERGEAGLGVAAVGL